MEREIYRMFADVFEYPGTDYAEKVHRVVRALNETYPEAGTELQGYYDHLPYNDHPEPRKAMEEIFTRTFDVQAITTLDIGYVVFGDDYKRGELLVNLSREQKAAGTDCGSELADHLSNLLQLIAAHEDQAMMAELVEMVVGPALRQMVGEFDPARVEQKDKMYVKHHRTLIDKARERNAIYQRALRAVYLVLQTDFGLPEVTASSGPVMDFLETLGKELEIEKDEGVPLGSCQSGGDESPVQRMPGSC